MANIHSVSLKGIRNQNEDRHSVIINLDGHDKNIAPINFFGVYDGHGGKFVSNFLAESLPNLFIDKRIIYPVSRDYINKAFKFLEQKVLKQKYLDKALHCGSTCLVGIHYKKADQDYLNVMNVGDTRCVLCRDNFAIPLTKDHKPMWPEERHRIEKIGGKPYFDGDDWRIKDLSVSRAFGDFDAEPFVINTPDIFRYKLDKNDKFLIFACDGLWDVLSNQDVINFVLNECYDKDLITRINKNNNIARRIAEYALKKGSTDNLTVIVYFLN